LAGSHAGSGCAQCAYKHFGGKDLQAVYKLFAENSLDPAEDLVFMFVACFRYYFLTRVSYLLSTEIKGDYDGANRFCNLVNALIKDIRGPKGLLVDRLREVLVRLRGNPEWYDDLENDCPDLKIDGQIFLKELNA
jgi:hypothetical protein